MTSASPDSSQSGGTTGTTRSASVDCARTATGVCRVGVSSPHDSTEATIPDAVRVLGHEPVWIREETVSSWVENASVQFSLQVDVDLCLNGSWRTVTASITDRSEMTYPVFLERDVLEAYTLDISRTAEE